AHAEEERPHPVCEPVEDATYAVAGVRRHVHDREAGFGIDPLSGLGIEVAGDDQVFPAAEAIEQLHVAGATSLATRRGEVVEDQHRVSVTHDEPPLRSSRRRGWR